MARANYFRRVAETCLAGAQQANDEAERIMWRARAERWQQLASEAEAKADDEPLTPSTQRPLAPPPALEDAAKAAPPVGSLTGSDH